MTREELLKFGGSCSKNESRRKGLCFICKGPWGLDHSCLSDIEEMTVVEQGVILHVYQGEESLLEESMGSYDDTSKEYDQSYGVDDSSPDMHPCVVEEQLIVPMREGDQGVDERLMIQHRDHIEEHELDDTHSVRDESFLESQLVAHVEPMMEDEQTPLGPAIGVEQTTSREVVFADTCPQEMLEIDGVVLQEASR